MRRAAEFICVCGCLHMFQHSYCMECYLEYFSTLLLFHLFLDYEFGIRKWLRTIVVQCHHNLWVDCYEKEQSLNINNFVFESQTNDIVYDTVRVDIWSAFCMLTINFVRTKSYTNVYVTQNLVGIHFKLKGKLS